MSPISTLSLQGARSHGHINKVVIVMLLLLYTRIQKSVKFEKKMYDLVVVGNVMIVTYK